MNEKNCNKSKEKVSHGNLGHKSISSKSELKKTFQRCNTNNDFSEPTPNSTLRHLRYVQELKNKQYNTTSNNMLLNSVVTKTTNKLNFDAAHTVFKNLISININDSLLLPEKKMSILKKYKSTDKVPQPELCDFLEPIEALPHFVSEPNIKIQFSHREFDVFTSYYRFIK